MKSSFVGVHTIKSSSAFFVQWFNFCVPFSSMYNEGIDESFDWRLIVNEGLDAFTTGDVFCSLDIDSDSNKSVLSSNSEISNLSFPVIEVKVNVPSSVIGLPLVHVIGFFSESQIKLYLFFPISRTAIAPSIVGAWEAVSSNEEKEFNEHFSVLVKTIWVMETVYFTIPFIPVSFNPYSE